MEVKQRVQFRVVQFQVIVSLATAIPVAGEKREAFSLDFSYWLSASNQLRDILGLQRGIDVGSACRVDRFTESMSEKMKSVGGKSAV